MECVAGEPIRNACCNFCVRRKRILSPTPVEPRQIPIEMASAPDMWRPCPLDLLLACSYNCYEIDPWSGHLSQLLPLERRRVLTGRCKSSASNLAAFIRFSSRLAVARGGSSSQVARQASQRCEGNKPPRLGSVEKRNGMCAVYLVPSSSLLTFECTKRDMCSEEKDGAQRDVLAHSPRDTAPSRGRTAAPADEVNWL